MSARSRPKVFAVGKLATGTRHNVEADLAPGSLLARSTIWNMVGFIAQAIDSCGGRDSLSDQTFGDCGIWRADHRLGSSRVFRSV